VRIYTTRCHFVTRNKRPDTRWVEKTYSLDDRTVIHEWLFAANAGVERKGAKGCVKNILFFAKKLRGRKEGAQKELDKFHREDCTGDPVISCTRTKLTHALFLMKVCADTRLFYSRGLEMHAYVDFVACTILLWDISDTTSLNVGDLYEVLNPWTSHIKKIPSFRELFLGR